jgi:hypothetical protein
MHQGLTKHRITPIAIGNIGWHTFIIFTFLNALWVPIVYCFFPETMGLELEDIDHLFEKGGITGGVFTSRGKTVARGVHRLTPNLYGIEKNETDLVEHEVVETK